MQLPIQLRTECTYNFAEFLKGPVSLHKLQFLTIAMSI